MFRIIFFVTFQLQQKQSKSIVKNKIQNEFSNKLILYLNLYPFSYSFNLIIAENTSYFKIISVQVQPVFLKS